MPEYSTHGSINTVMTLLFKEGNVIREVIKDIDSNKQVFIFSRSLTPTLRRNILEDKKRIMTYDGDFFKFTATDSTDTILVPRNDTVYLNLKNLFKTSYGKNTAVTILLLNGLLIWFGLLYLDNYLSQHNLSFLFNEVVGYISSNGMITTEIALIASMLGIVALFYPSPLMFDPFVAQGFLMPKKNIIATLAAYLISGLFIAVEVYLVFPTNKEAGYSTLMYMAFLTSPTLMFLRYFNVAKSDASLILRFLFLNAKFIFQLALGIIILASLAPILFKINYVAALITMLLTILFAAINLTKAIYKSEIKNKYLRLLASGPSILFIIISAIFIFWIQTKIDIISSWHLGNYNQSLMVDEYLLKYRSTLEQLNYNPKQQNIQPWVILQTDKVLVVAKDKNSKKLFYFRKYPYSLISQIDLPEK